MINFWKMTVEALKKQRNQYKTERDTCLEDIEKLRKRNKELKDRNDKLNEIFDYQENKKKEYRETIEKLNRENRDYKVANSNLADYGHEWKTECHKVERKFEKVATAYKTLTNHIRMKAEANPGVSRYIDLVKYIDRLERD